MSKTSTYKNPPGTRVLAEHTRAEGVLRVCENDSHRWLDFGTPFTQSLMSRADPASLELEYAPGMALAHAFNPKAEQLLNFGAGCGTFERFFATHLPDLKIESVELETALIDLAKQYFSLPSNHEIQPSSAQSYLDKTEILADIVLCDLHNGDKNPSCLIDPNFYQDLREHMNDGSVLALNLLPTDEHDLIEVRMAVQSSFKWQYLLEFENITNVMLYALNQQAPKKQQLKDQAARLERVTNINFCALIDRLKALPQLPQFGSNNK